MVCCEYSSLAIMIKICYTNHNANKGNVMGTVTNLKNHLKVTPVIAMTVKIKFPMTPGAQLPPSLIEAANYIRSLGGTFETEINYPETGESYSAPDI